LLRGRPFPCVGYGDARGLPEECRPRFLPRWIIVFAWTVILLARDQHDI
jgi:hypothetical protein